MSGLLSGSVATYASTQYLNLTSLAGIDWAAFGYNVNAASIERKTTGGSKISALSQVGSIALNNFNNTAAPIVWLPSWTDGTPDASVTNEGWLVYSLVTAGQGPGPGMSFTVPADTTVRTLKLYAYVYTASGSITGNGKLTATLSDASAGPYVDTSVTAAGSCTLVLYTITYNAASSGCYLTVSLTNNTALAQQVGIQAATLSVVSPPVITGTIQVGQVLTTSGGICSCGYQWYSEGSPIIGATSSTYTLQNADIGCHIQVASSGIFSALSVPVIGATVRYVSMTDGLDTNDGTTSTAGAPHGPWKTLTHVNAQTFAAGTSVLFKRGDTWRTDGCSTSSGAQLSPASSGSVGNPIVFDAYGTGASPVLDGSYDLSTTGAWSLISGNVWQSVHTFNGFGHTNGLPNNAADDPGNLIWGISAVGGTNVPPALVNAHYGVMAGTGTNNIWWSFGQAGLTTAGQWNFNTTTNKIQVYCTSNPATGLSGVNGDLRAAIDTCLIYFNNQSNIIFQNFTLQYSGATAINTGGAGGTCNNITIRDMVVQWIGGGNISGASSTDSRYGDGWDIEGGCSGMLMDRVWWHQIYDTGPGPQCGSPHQDGIAVRNNVCTYCGAFFSTFFLGGTPTAYGLSIYNNTVYCTQNCWSNYPAPGQRPNNPGPGFEENVSALVINTVSTSAAPSNMYVANNIFAGIGGIGSSPGFGIIATGWNVTGANASNPYTTSDPNGSGVWLDYNCWPVNINGGAAQRIALHSGNYNMSDWVKGVNSPSGAGTFTPALEVHGIFGSDPLFTSQSALNFTLQSGSPCINAGANLYNSGVVWDYNKNPRPTSGAFTMGAFQ